MGSADAPEPLKTFGCSLTENGPSGLTATVAGLIAVQQDIGQDSVTVFKTGFVRWSSRHSAPTLQQAGSQELDWQLS